MTALICRNCVTPIIRRDLLSWWACACRVWATDEQLARRTG